jgi:hypothetical protein
VLKLAVAAGIASMAVPLYPHETITTTVAYDKEIVRVLRKKCTMCHSADNLGMPLTTWEETRPWARDIEEQVLERHMPTWSAISGYGHFSNDIGLTNREIQFIVSWVEGNGPKSRGEGIENFGEGTVAPKAAPSGLQWKNGKPDAIVPLAGEALEPGDTNLVRRVTLDPHITAEKLVQSIEFEPDDRRVLRAAVFSVKETGQWLGSWTPWAPVTTLPENTAFRIPAGSHIVAELHFQAPNERVKSGGSLGLHFAAKPAAHHPSDMVLETRREGPADAPRFRCASRIAAESQVLAFLPELPDGIDSFDVSARKPDGTTEVLLLVRHAMPDWPMPYVLSDPVTLPANTEIMLTAYPRAGREMTEVRLTVSLSR